MKKSKKFVLAGLALLAITMVLLPLSGCKNDTVPEPTNQEQTGDSSGGAGTDQEPTQYTVTFNANGGTGTMAPQTFVEGMGQKLTANGFTNGVKSFVGWAESADGAVKYTDGQEVTIAANATLYARWQVTAAEGTVAVVVSADGNSTPYTDLSAAVSALAGTKGSTLYATKNIDDASAFELQEGSEFTVDLNGCTISFAGGVTAITVVENSSLTITDGYGEGKLYNEDDNLIVNSGDLTILGGTLEVRNISSSGYATIGNNATMTISGGIVTNNNAHAISTPLPLQLSGNPVVSAGGDFASFGDLYEPINLVGALGANTYTIEASNIIDDIIVKGEGYTITEEDVKKFSLIGGKQTLTLDASANTIIRKWQE